MRVSIVDNGLGIKQENQGKIFQLFQSFKDDKRKINTKGIGLGLVICKKIVQKFNGSIAFLSEFEQGTTFFFNFETRKPDLIKPKEKQKVRQLREIKSAQQEERPDYFVQLERVEAFRTNRVLVADDEEFCIASMKAMLAKAGLDIEMQVDYCINGQEVVDQVKKAARAGIVYKIIFTDFSMPVKDGYQAT